MEKEKEKKNRMNIAIKLAKTASSILISNTQFFSHFFFFQKIKIKMFSYGGPMEPMDDDDGLSRL